jgi:PAS domain S-box-containing protein
MSRNGGGPPPLEDALKLLLAREPLFGSLGETLPAGIFIADVRGRSLYTNGRFQTICGVTPDQAHAEHWAACLESDDRERVRAEWDDAVARQIEWQSEFRCRHPDGSLRWISAQSAPLRDTQGLVIGHVGAFEDVTLRTRLQSKLFALIEASGILLESPRLDAVLPATMRIAKDLIAADGYAVWRLHGAAEWRVAASTGISTSFAESIIQTFRGGPVAPVPFSAPMAVEDVASLPMLDHRQAAYASEGIRSMLVVPLKIGGAFSATLVFYYRMRQRFDEIRTRSAGALGNLAAVAISTAELYEEQLRQRAEVERAHRQAAFLAEASIALGSSLEVEATLSTVAQLAVPRIADWCAVDMLDSDGRLKQLAVAHVDPAKVEFARSFRERYPEDPDSPTSVHQVVRSGRPVMMSSIPDALLVAAARDEEHLRALRELGLTSFMCVPLIANGRTLGAITFVTAESSRPYTAEDVQFAQAVAERAALAVDNARAYNEVRAANRAKDEFLATLSHELRTPINAIMGWGQMLQQGVVDPARTAQAVNAIVRNASAQSRLIEDLLDLSRIISGKLRLDVEIIDVSGIVTAAVAAVEPAGLAKGVRIQTVVDAGSGRVYGDRQRLQQAVWNLLSNAVKFTPRGGRVQLQVLRVNSHLEIVVSDTGQGIPADVLPYVFDRFRQADSTSTRQHSGLGLGLAIVRHIMELHGGTAEASSEGPGLGATFRLKLPLSVANTGAMVNAAPVVHPAVPTITAGSLAAAALPDLAGTRVLVVEDEPDAREMVAYLLRQRNAEVIVAASVDDALKEIDERVPDVLLCDIEMPGRDGHDLIRTLRARPAERGGSVPAAALTAYSRPEDRAQSMLAGFDAHLSKPVDLAELVATVVRLNARRPRSASTPA